MTNNARYIVNTIIFKATNDKPYELANNPNKALAICEVCPFKASGECERGKYFEDCYAAELRRDALELECDDLDY